jgi:hypothetical protein
MENYQREWDNYQEKLSLYKEKNLPETIVKLN